MMREMTLGQYYKADSILHKLDPRVKLMATLVYVISVFLPKSICAMIMATAVLVIVIMLSKVPLRMYLRGIKPLLPIIVFSAIMNIFFLQGKVLFSFGFIHITKEGLIMAAFMLLRLMLLIIGTSVMTFTSTPNQLMDGIEKAFHFLKRFKVPVHELAMMMSIALRFIPIMTEELDKIMKAQLSRGADFEEGNLLERAKKLIPVLVPLLVSAIRRASELALAMDARCYNGGEGRTKLHPLKYSRRDFISYAMEAGYLVCMIIVSVLLPL